MKAWKLVSFAFRPVFSANYLRNFYTVVAMNEITKILETKEKVLWDGTPKYSAYIASIVLVAVLVGGLVGVFIGAYFHLVGVGIAVGLILLVGILIVGNLSYKVTHYAITSKRVVIQHGIIGRDFRSINYDNIQNASANVGLLGVIFKVGTVNIFTGEMETVGTGKSTKIQPKYDKLQYVDKPYDVLKILQTNLSKREENMRK